MAQDSYVRLAPDSTGKRVEMDKYTATVEGVEVDVYTQRAVLVGETAEVLRSIERHLHNQTLYLQGIFAVLRSSNPEFAGVDPSLMTYNDSL